MIDVNIGLVEIVRRDMEKIAGKLYKIVCTSNELVQRLEKLEGGWGKEDQYNGIPRASRTVVPRTSFEECYARSASGSATAVEQEQRRG